VQCGCCHGRLGAASTTDFVFWQDDSQRARFPDKAKRGTVVHMPRAFADGIV